MSFEMIGRANSKLETLLAQNGAVNVTEHVQRITRITFSHDGIGVVSDHMAEIDAIRTASDGDVLILYFTGCPGGVVDTGMAIMNAILQTKAHTIAVIEGHNASLATIIPMVCKEVFTTPFCSFMLHSAAGYGNYATVANSERASKHFAELYSAMLEDVYEGFCTQEEIEKIKDGVEIYLHEEEIENRLKARAEAFEKAEKAGEEDKAVKPKPKAARKKTPAKKTTQTKRK